MLRLVPGSHAPVETAFEAGQQGFRGSLGLERRL